MVYQRKNRQVSYGEAIGILLLDSPIPYIPGDVANATTYGYPVRFQKVSGFTVKRAIGRDESIYPDLLEAARTLKENGVRAVTGDCGFMALHQNQLKEDLGLPVFLSSLLQIPFIRHLIPETGKIGILTASGRNLTPSFIEAIGIGGSDDLVIRGLEESPEFRGAVLEEKGTLDEERMEAEVADAARGMIAEDADIRVFLLECSVLPPYGKAVAAATGLPVFDYVTMIDYVFSALVKRGFSGFM